MRNQTFKKGAQKLLGYSWSMIYFQPLVAISNTTGCKEHSVFEDENDFGHLLYLYTLY